ncbi:hypothetical protein GT348_03790 [Aristophania vespae]|uniref:Uncharacterized protein n=1 Tax=Aristophania vespae TaxID=2697033 RepID=A0A6P1NG94_9PROT|nr:hypothetical protein [Aristophania vespae]QHI95504.1 hypothetical protein GT348_03790 [Aristophania vespae]
MHSSLAMPARKRQKEAVITPEKTFFKKLAESLFIFRQALSAVLNGRSDLILFLALRLEKTQSVKANALMKILTTYEMAVARERKKYFQVKSLSTRNRRAKMRLSVERLI